MSMTEANNPQNQTSTLIDDKLRIYWRDRKRAQRLRDKQKKENQN
jgi:hypothetical protein